MTPAQIAAIRAELERDLDDPRLIVRLDALTLLLALDRLARDAR